MEVVELLLLTCATKMSGKRSGSGGMGDERAPSMLGSGRGSKGASLDGQRTRIGVRRHSLRGLELTWRASPFEFRGRRGSS